MSIKVYEFSLLGGFTVVIVDVSMFQRNLPVVFNGRVKFHSEMCMHC